MEELKVSKNSVAIKYGVISGLISIVSFLIQDFAGLIGNQEYAWIGSVVSIGVIVTIIYLAQKEFKDSGDGYMEYGEGLGLGILISVYAGIISSVFSFVYIKYVNSEFLDSIREQQIMALEEQGLSDAQIEQASGMMDLMSSPGAFLILGLIGSVFIGFIVSLILTAFTKMSKPEFE